MCVIVGLTKKGKIPIVHDFKEMERVNPDGAGIAWIDKSRNIIRWQKGLSAVEIFRLASELPRPLLIHFRFATQGGKSLELNHPFPISRFAQTDKIGCANAVLAHNGNWLKWQEIVTQMCIRKNIEKPKGLWSDSRAIAWIAYLAGRSVLDVIGEKVCALTPKGMEFFGGGWNKREGNYYSNLYWKSYGIYTTTPARAEDKFTSPAWVKAEQQVRELNAMRHASIPPTKEEILHALNAYKEYAPDSDYQETFNYFYNNDDNEGENV